MKMGFLWKICGTRDILDARGSKKFLINYISLRGNIALQVNAMPDKYIKYLEMAE